MVVLNTFEQKNIYHDICDFEILIVQSCEGVGSRMFGTDNLHRFVMQSVRRGSKNSGVTGEIKGLDDKLGVGLSEGGVNSLLRCHFSGFGTIMMSMNNTVNQIIIQLFKNLNEQNWTCSENAFSSLVMLFLPHI